MTTINIKLDSVEQIESYVKKVTSYTNDINIKKGSLEYDAKSILSVLAVLSKEPMNISIISSNEDIVKKFVNDMEEFRCD